MTADLAQPFPEEGRVADGRRERDPGRVRRQGAESRELGRRQGLYATANTASLAIAASVSGYLFTLNEALPFTVMALISALLTLTTLVWWRDVRGHVRAATVN
jgi:hypothetical protein